VTGRQRSSELAIGSAPDGQISGNRVDVALVEAAPWTCRGSSACSGRPPRAAVCADARRSTRSRARSHSAPVPTFTIDAAAPDGLPAVLRASQRVFGRTGGLHAAALFDRDGRDHRGLRRHRTAQCGRQGDWPGASDRSAAALGGGAGRERKRRVRNRSESPGRGDSDRGLGLGAVQPGGSAGAGVQQTLVGFFADGDSLCTQASTGLPHPCSGRPHYSPKRLISILIHIAGRDEMRQSGRAIVLHTRVSGSATRPSDQAHRRRLCDKRHLRWISRRPSRFESKSRASCSPRAGSSSSSKWFRLRE
jgi:hypothetical protein